MSSRQVYLMIPMLMLASAAVADDSSRAGSNTRPYIEAGFNRADLESSKGEFPATIRDIPELNSSFDTANLYSGAIGIAGESLRAELAYINTRHDLDATGAAQALSDEVKASATFFNVWYRFFPDSRWHPFAGAGLGYFDIEFETSRKRKLGLQGGLGLDYEVLPGLNAGIRGQYISAGHTQFKKGQADEFALDYDLLSYGLSLRYEFGAKAAEAPVPEVAAVVPVAALCADGQDNDGDGDGDGDGKIDFPADTGCSAADDGDETDPSACSDGKDNDADGQIDFPADKGCSAADDNDETDPCKTPEAGEKISLSGCGTGDVVVLRGVNFEFNESRLTPNAKTILDGVADELAAYPELHIELGGHTDARGSDDYNQRLSEQRARSVVSYLASRNVAEDRMNALGYGETQPVADNETDAGRELNRRVELKVTAK